MTEPSARQVRRIAPNAELDALLVEYEALLADERSYATTLATLASVALALVAFVAAGSFGSDQVPVCRTGATATCTYFRLLSPLAPIVVILYVELIALVGVVRSFQIRQAEERIRELLPPVPRAGSNTGAQLVREPPIASIITTQLGLASLRRGSPTYRLLYFGVVALTVALFAGVVGFSLSEIHHATLRHVGFALYGALGLFIGGSSAYWFAHGPAIWRAAFERARSRYDERIDDTLRHGRRLTRSAFFYLLLPRPGELLVKPWCEVGAAVFVYFAISPAQRWGSVGTAGARLLIVVLLFELLGYQARYQLNDLRGLPSDAKHPRKDVRRRLTVVADAVGNVRAVRLSAWVALTRIILLPALAFFLLDGRAAWSTVAAAALAFGIALPYEWLRAHRPERGLAPAAEGRWNSAIYIAVGPGYALRGALGMLVVTSGLPWTHIGVLAAALLLLGGMWVTMTWALESMNDVVPDEVGAVSRGKLVDKPHVRALALAAVGPRRVPSDPTQWKVLLYRSDRRFALVWNRFFVSALVLAAIGAALLYPGRTSMPLIVLSVAAAIFAAWLLCAATTTASILGCVAALEATGAIIASVDGQQLKPVLFSFGLLGGLSLVYAGFRLVSYDELFGYVELARRVSAALKRVPAAVRVSLLLTLLGRETADLLGREHSASVGATGQREASSPGASVANSAGDPDPFAQGLISSFLEIADLSQLVEVVQHLRPATLVLDMEPGICPWDSSDEEIAESLAAQARRWGQIPSLKRVMVRTNSARRPLTPPELEYVSRARKPFRVDDLRAAPVPVLICGDQLLTDGLLAWRLGATFVQLRWRGPCPALPRAQSAFGRLLRPLFFPADGTTSERDVDERPPSPVGAT